MLQGLGLSLRVPGHSDEGSLGERERPGLGPIPRVGPQTQQSTSASQDPVCKMEMGTPASSVCPAMDRASAQPTAARGSNRVSSFPPHCCVLLGQWGRGTCTPRLRPGPFDSTLPGAAVLNVMSLEQQHLSTGEPAEHGNSQPPLSGPDPLSQNSRGAAQRAAF